MNRQTPTVQVTPEENLPTLTYSLLAKISVYFTGRPIYRNNSAPEDPSVGNDIPWSPTSLTSTLVDTPRKNDPSPQVPSVQRRHPRNPMKPGDPYAQFRWGYGRHLFGPASSTDSPVVIPATGSDLFRPPKISFPSYDPAFKSEDFYRRKSQELEILEIGDDSDDEFFDTEEFFDTSDTGDTELVDARPKIEVHHAFSLDQEEWLRDADLVENIDIDSFRRDFRENMARLDPEYGGRK
ncbi:hypothetical protein MMC27_006833 [Xylographa pallens]|nr:hypothetical protein [Xylographa pallens]